MRVDSYKNAFIFLIVVQISYFSLVIFKGYVIYPHNNGAELLATAGNDEFVSNRKFSDESSQYIPIINQHLNGNHRSWISTWDPHVQLGYQTVQTSGFSKSYLITHLLSFFTSNPFRLYTMLTAITVLLTGIFFFLFLKSLDLNPVACVVAAIGLSTGIFFSYWLTFAMFLSVRCWTICLLWLITIFIKKKSYLVGLGIAFAAYSLIMTGRFQAIILQAYIVCPYTLIYLYKSNGTLKTKFNTALMLIGLVFVGFIMTSPVMVDLFIKTHHSARLEVPEDFFLTVLPKITNLKNLSAFSSSIFDPFWIGNPIKPDYPVNYSGFSLCPLYFGLFVMSFFNGLWRKLWPWQLFLILCFIAEVWSPGYLFMIRYLPIFNLSRGQPLGGAIIPVFVLCGYAVDYYLRNKPNKKSLLIQIIVFALLPVLMAVSAFWQGPNYLRQLNGIFILISCLIIAGLIAFVTVRKSFILIILTVVCVFAYSFNLMLTRPLDSIHTSSTLSEAIGMQTSNGSRYAKIGPHLSRVIVSNQEILLGLRSIHSYDSLSSKNYQDMILKISEKGTKTYGRFFNYITSTSKLRDAPFSYTGVSLLLLLTKSELKLQKTPTAPILYAQTANYKHTEDNQIIFEGFLNEHAELDVEQTVSFDDMKKFKVTPSDSKTILFISQQYHPQWNSTSKGKPLETVVVNDFYQGVIIPPGTSQIQLSFRPYVLWSWVPQLIFVVLATMPLAHYLKKRFS